MDPALQEKLLPGLDPEEVIEAVIRLKDSAVIPDKIGVVTQFGDIITVRIKRSDVLEVYHGGAILSLKASRFLGGDIVEIEEVSESEAPEAAAPVYPGISGKGVVIGIIDYGADFAHVDFINRDGSTRLLAIWDQTVLPAADSPQPFGYGKVYHQADINEALTTETPYQTLGYHPGKAAPKGAAHGTHVMGIAAGNGRSGALGIASESELVFVHLCSKDVRPEMNLGDSGRLLEAIDFIQRMAGEKSLVINISVGRHGGPHDGSTLTEMGMDNFLAQRPNTAICQSTGNYFESNTHASGVVLPGRSLTFSFMVDPADITPNELEVWYAGRDTFGLVLRHDGTAESYSCPLNGKKDILRGGEVIGRMYHRARDPNNLKNHINIFLYANAPDGKWSVELIGEEVVDGRYNAWIERDSSCGFCQSRFDAEHAETRFTTGTICNGFNTIVVGAIDPQRQLVAPFSSSGPTVDGRQKPNILAPGVGIIGPKSSPLGSKAGGKQKVKMSGTSMAAPHVTGTVALMMEAGPLPLNALLTRTILLKHAQPLGGNSYDHRMGNGVLDAHKTLDYIIQKYQKQPAMITAPEKIFPEDNLPVETEEYSPAAEHVCYTGCGETIETENHSGYNGSGWFSDTPSYRPGAFDHPETIPAYNLSWPGATLEQLAFMRRVYEICVHQSSRVRAFVNDVPPRELELIENGHSARTAAARSCVDMFADARRAISAQRVNVAIGITSGYRSASRQFQLWQNNFPGYFGETSAQRKEQPGGELGEAAAALLAAHIRKWIATPGFSNHNNGLAVDLFTIEDGTRLSANRRNIVAWRRSWFWVWLSENASRYGFFQNTAINEPWHWEYRGVAIPEIESDPEEESAIIESGGGTGKKLNKDKVKYLCFEGGGGKGLIYVGAIRALEQLGILKYKEGQLDRQGQIKGFSGASAGAITAMALSIGYSSKEIHQELSRTNLNKLFDLPSIPSQVPALEKNCTVRNTDLIFDDFVKHLMQSLLDRLAKITVFRPLIVGIYNVMIKESKSLIDKALEKILKEKLNVSEDSNMKEKLVSALLPLYLNDFIKDLGFFSGCNAQKFLAHLIEKKTGKSNLTFEQHYKQYGIELRIVGYNVEKDKVEYFSRITTPHMGLADAVRISMSLPYVYKPVRISRAESRAITGNNYGLEGLWLDGGTRNNTPIRVFDNEPGENPKTLGIRLSYDEKDHKKISNILDLIRNYTLMPGLMGTGESDISSTSGYREQTITLDTGSFEMWDFNPSTDLLNKLLDKATKEVLGYFAN